VVVGLSGNDAKSELHNLRRCWRFEAGSDGAMLHQAPLSLCLLAPNNENTDLVIVSAAVGSGGMRRDEV
jgi:hypothetical protein